jgi:hypothetical protein
MMERLAHKLWVLAVITAALLAIGCGGASAEAKAPGIYGGAAADRDYDGVADESDVASEAPPPEPEMYAVSTASAPSRDERPVAQGPAGPPAPPARPPPAKKPVPDTAGEPAPDTPTVDTGSAPQVAAPLLIYTADVHLAVFEAKKALDEAEKMARELGGYLVRRDNQSITVRVPAGKFDGALAKMIQLGDVLHREVTVQDVTAEYHDLAVRLKNAEAVRDRLEELLKKAVKVEEAIQVERELARVTAEIESMKGRLKLLRELVSFSTITLRFRARPVENIGSKVQLPFPWLHQLGLSNLLRL